MHRRHRLFLIRHCAAASFLTLAMLAAPALAGREDQQARVDNNADRDAIRAQERAARDEARVVEERTRAEIRAAEDTARANADAAEAAARAAEDAAKSAADAAEQAAKDAADAAEQAAKDAADAAEEAAKAAEDAAKDAADAAEEAARAAAEGDGGASAMHGVAAEESPERDNRDFPVRRGELIALDITPATRAAAVAQGFRIVGETRIAALDSAVTRLATPRGQSAADALATLRRLDGAGNFDFAHYYAEQVGVADGGSTSDDVPTDPAPLRFTQSAEPIAPRLQIGMIDTGVADHPALLGVRLQRHDFGDGVNQNDHGTAVASVLAAEGVGRIVAASVFRGTQGNRFTSPEAIVAALGWLVHQQVRVINVSLAGPRNQVLDQLIARARTNGIIVVAAAGNGGPTAAPAYPAALPGVVAVTAIDRSGRVYRHANQGAYIRFAALGVGVRVASPGSRFAAATGTSYAAPHVAALVARCAGRANSGAVDRCLETLDRRAVDLGAAGRDPVYGVGALR